MCFLHLRNVKWIEREKRERDLEGMRKKVTIMGGQNEGIEKETIYRNEKEKNNERESYSGQR